MIIPAVETLSNNSAVLIFEPSSCNDLHNCRTIWNIIWSSLFTLFACVWLSVHPNVPARDDSWGRIFIRRVWTMIAVLLAPEFLVGWAMRQRIIASQIAKDNKKYGWTKTHGFFVVMGGFIWCDKDGPVRTVPFDEVDAIPKKTKKHILEEQINDKSKGDALSKAFAILQTTWFILQCISRSVEDLPVTELEIATVAFCALNFATYVVWWNKPLNVCSPVQVYADGEMTEDVEEEAEAGKEEAEKHAAEERGWIDACRDMWKGWKDSTWKGFKQGLFDIPKEASRPITAMAKKHGVFKTIVGFPLALIVIILDGESFESTPKRVGTFGPSYGDTALDMFTSAAVGTVFGAIHCTAWNSQFASHTEQLLWRVAATSVTTVPLLIAVVFGASYRLRNVNRRISDFLISIILAAAGALYILARLALLVLPLMSLRSLPPGVFNSVNWIRFIPHI